MRIALITLLWLLGCPIWAQNQHFTTWSLEEGLPQSQVYALHEDRQGYLWAGTQGGGVCCFDGQQFKVYSVQEGLPSNYVQAIYEDKAGKIWVGTKDGAAYFDGHQFIKIQSSASIHVFSFAQIDGGKTLVLGTDKGVWRHTLGSDQCQKWDLSPSLNRSYVLAVHEAKKEGVLWMGTQEGIWYIHTNAPKAIHFNQENNLPLVPVRAFAQMGTTLWGVQSDASLVAIDITKRAIRKVTKHDAFENATCLLSNPDATLWVGTQNRGLALYSPEKDAIVTQLSESEGLPHNHIRVLTRDHHQRLWIGSSGGGFACMGSQSFRQYTKSDGLPGNRIYSLLESADGGLLMGVSQQGLVGLTPSGQVYPFLGDSGYLMGTKSRTLAKDENGDIWVGTEGKGLVRLSNKRPEVFKAENGFLPSDWVQKILFEHKNALWVATSEGLSNLLFNQSDSIISAKWHTKYEDIPLGSVSALALDREGNPWFGTANGMVGVLKNGRIASVFRSEKGLPALPISTLVFDESGRCWVGTKGGGIFMKNLGKDSPFLSVKIPESALSQNIYLLNFDLNGHLWVGTETGVDELVLAEGKVVSVNHFGKQEGFGGIETCQDAGLCDTGGHIWFGTMNGLMQYLPNAGKRISAPPLLHFESINLFYKPIEQTEFGAKSSTLFDSVGVGLSLPWHQNHLNFSFKAIELLDGQSLRYRWKLEEPDQDWSPWTDQTQVNYANLAPGTYRFMVEATSDGLHVSRSVFAKFTIQVPFWQRWYFRLGLLMSLSILIGWGVRAYIRKIRRSEAERRHQLEVQNKLLQLEQKALQLQMNPHFIFNALNSIQSLIATKDYSVARQEINQFAKLMRSILNNSRKTTITLHDEMETLVQYLQIEQFCQQNPFTFSVQNLTQADPESLDLPPMLLQPFVENAVVHGVSHLSYPGHIEVIFELKKGMLACKVIDNGPGLGQSALLKAAKRPGHQSAALVVTKERLVAIGGSLDLRDRLDEQGVVCGTLVEINIKIG